MRKLTFGLAPLVLWALLFSPHAFGFKAATQTQLTTRYFKTRNSGTHLLSNATVSLDLDNLIAYDQLHGLFETLWNFTPQDDLDLYIYELYYKTPYVQDQVALSVGRQMVSYGFHPLMADLAQVHWKGTSSIKGTAYAGNAYFENELNLRDLPWNPMAGAFVQIKPAPLWQITPAARYLQINSEPFAYTTLHLSKAWPLFQSKGPSSEKYPWYKRSVQQGQFVSEAQIEYEAQSKKMTGLMGQLHYTTPDGFHARGGAEFFHQPLLTKLADHQNSVADIFGINELTEAFVALSPPLTDSLSMSATYSHHIYPLPLPTLTRHGNLSTLDGQWVFHEGDLLNWQLRYYTGFGGWLVGSSLEVSKLFWSFLTAGVLLDIDQYEKVNGIQALSTALRQKTRFEISRNVKTELVFDVNRNHHFAINFRTMAHLIFSYD